VAKLKLFCFLPFSLGVITAGALGLGMAVHALSAPPQPGPSGEVEASAPVFPAAAFSAVPAGLSSTPGGGVPAFFEVPERGDPLLAYYEDDFSRERLIAFFGMITGSGEVAGVILGYARSCGIPLALAFALSWEESRYNTRAVNRRNSNKSVDRGLFQLNSVSFPKLTEPDFFDPATNAYYGLSHLRWCLDDGGSEIVGLAMYNAGTGRVRSGATPKVTLDYVSRILENRRKIEELFFAWNSRYNPPAPLDPPLPAPKNALSDSGRMGKPPLSFLGPSGRP
jgi:hypothetical protein